jgi:hypothetical protein
MKGRWALLLLIAIVLCCTGLAQTSQGHVLLRDAGLYETPATYTELAFSDPQALPSSLVKPSGNVTVSFGIHNVSDAPRSYDWSIVLAHSGKSQVQASGTVLTSPYGRTTVTKSVVAECVGGQLQVVVRLASPAESISFWMTCPSTAGTKQATK